MRELFLFGLLLVVLMGCTSQPFIVDKDYRNDKPRFGTSEYDPIFDTREEVFKEMGVWCASPVRVLNEHVYDGLFRTITISFECLNTEEDE